jgi:hypothetical protein
MSDVFVLVSIWCLFLEGTIENKEKIENYWENV